MTSKKKTNMTTRAVAVSALFTALILVTTSYVKVPTALGYIHAGDVFILVACFILPWQCAIPAAALGGLLADLIAGYAVYMPVTAVAKAVMAAIAWVFYYKSPKLWKTAAGGVISSLVMLFAYFVFESFYYGKEAAAANFIVQLIQPAISIPIAVAAVAALKRIPFVYALKEGMKISGRKKLPGDSARIDKK